MSLPTDVFRPTTAAHASFPSLRKPLPEPLAKWPLTLNTGRYRDQWHSMTRTGLAPKLARHREEPLVEVHPDDGARLGLADGGLARVETPQGDSIFRVALHAGQRRGEAVRADPLDRPHQQRRPHRPAFPPARRSGVGPAGFQADPSIDRRGRDQMARLPSAGAANSTPARNACGRRASPVPSGALWELAGNGDLKTIEALLPRGERIEAQDAARGTRRIAIVADGRLAAALFVTESGELPPRDWLIAQLYRARESPRPCSPAARPACRPIADPIICVCFDIGLKTIAAAIRDQALADVAAIGARDRGGHQLRVVPPGTSQGY